MFMLTFSLRQLYSELEEECEILASQVDLDFYYVAQNMNHLDRSRRLVTSHPPPSGSSRN